MTCPSVRAITRHADRSTLQRRLQLASRPIRSASVVTVDTDQDEFLTVADIANRLKLNQQTIYNWI